METLENPFFYTTILSLILIISLTTGFLMIRRLKGRSMEPTIPEDSVLICLKTFSYQEGDIVTYDPGWTDETLVTHRIVDELDGGYVLKGDNNPGHDPGIVSRDKIICEIVYYFRI